MIVIVDLLREHLHNITMADEKSAEETVIFITAPHEDDAVKIARTLVKARLAACVNIVKNVRSIYTWQGNIEDDSEVLMIVKTRKSLFSALSAKVKDIHRYDVPEIIALPITAGSEEYLRWLQESTE